MLPVMVKNFSPLRVFAERDTEAWQRVEAVFDHDSLRCALSLRRRGADENLINE